MAKKKQLLKVIKTVLIVFAILICLYEAFSYAFFFYIPDNKNVDKNRYAGEGYVYPLSMVDSDDLSEYVVIFEKDCKPGEYYVIEDSEFIKKYKDFFVVYKTKWCFKLQDHRDFVVIKDGKRVSYSNLGNFPTALCYDDLFMSKCRKISSLGEYCKEKNIDYYWDRS